MPELPSKPPYTSLAILGVLAVAVFAIVHGFTGVERGQTSGAGLQKLGTLTDVGFLGPNGDKVRLSDFRGAPVVLNVWATWCGPCVEEMPSLDRLQRDFPGVQVIAVSLDKGGTAEVEKFFRQESIRHLKIYADPTMDLMASLGIEGLPVTMLIGADGREVGSLTGGQDWDTPTARAAVTALGGTGGHNSEDEPISVKGRAPLPSDRLFLSSN